MVKDKQKSYINHNGKEIKIAKGKNIRFSDKSHKLLSAYCRTKGYNLGAFCEIGALDRMKLDATNNI